MGIRRLAESFAERWAQKERECGFEAIASTMIPCGADVLPNSAAPFLTFKEAARPVRIWDVFASPSDWSSADRERLAPYRMIGSDGAGNPICVEQDSGAVILLDHEDWFRTREFVNSSVRQLAKCLLAYLGEREAQRFRAAVEVIDPTALVDGAFWSHEAAYLDTVA
jgi:SUKH-4 immunity protein